MYNFIVGDLYYIIMGKACITSQWGGCALHHNGVSVYYIIMGKVCITSWVAVIGLGIITS